MVYYSGKKKRHAVKTQMIVNNHGFIIHKIGYKKGKRHDYDVYKNNHPVTPKQVVNVIDLGYLGIENEFPERLSSIPQRKKRNLDLSAAEERYYNKDHSKRRIIIEHTICRLKNTGYLQMCLEISQKA